QADAASETEADAEAADAPEPDGDVADTAADATEKPENETRPAAEAKSRPNTDESESAPRAGFEALGFDERVLRSIKSVGNETPSAIQEATIPVLMQGRDVVGLAQTGTGKTAAFALPILSRIEPGQGVPQ